MLQYIAIMMAARFKKEEGAAAVEYGLLVAGIAVVVTPAVFLFGHFVSSLFIEACSAIQNGGTSNGVCLRDP
jgi:pilus assembly protein Flp/PilA